MGYRGRKRESAEILEFKGKSHKTKAELEVREQSRVVIGNAEFVEPEYVSANETAHEKWDWIIDLYTSSVVLHDHITSAMTDQIASYCVLFSEQVGIAGRVRFATGDDRNKLTNQLLKVTNELNRIGKDLLLDFFSQAKVTLPKKEEEVNPGELEMFGR